MVRDERCNGSSITLFFFHFSYELSMEGGGVVKAGCSTNDASFIADSVD